MRPVLYRIATNLARIGWRNRAGIGPTGCTESENSRLAFQPMALATRIWLVPRQMSPNLPPKIEVAMALLERASMFIHLDPSSEDVHVPAWLRKQPQLVLQIGLNMAVKIPDLQVEDDAISCTLSFSRRPYYCRLPWTAIYALVGEDGRGMVWPEDIPAEVAAQTQSAQQRPTPLRSVPDPFAAEESNIGLAPRGLPAMGARPALVPVDGGRGSKPAVARRVQPAGAEPNGKRNSERPYLRLVK